MTRAVQTCKARTSQMFCNAERYNTDRTGWEAGIRASISVQLMCEDDWDPEKYLPLLTGDPRQKKLCRNVMCHFYISYLSS